MKVDNISNMSNIQSKNTSNEKRDIDVENSSRVMNTQEMVRNEEFDKGANAGTAEIINDEMINKSIEIANKTLKQHNSIIERSVHEVTKTVMYVIRDTETNEVIKEFPPKKIQDMIAKMWELAGLFVDKKA